MEITSEENFEVPAIASCSFIGDSNHDEIDITGTILFLIYFSHTDKPNMITNGKIVKKYILFLY